MRQGSPGKGGDIPNPAPAAEPLCAKAPASKVEPPAGPQPMDPEILRLFELQAAVGMAEQAVWGRAQVETPSFKNWFGNSKVLWEGKPLVVFHGTRGTFSAFDPARVGQNFGDAAGIFFTNNVSYRALWTGDPSLGDGRAPMQKGPMEPREGPDYDYARPRDPWYTRIRLEEDQTSAGAYAANAKGEGGASLVPAWIRLENPLVIDRDLDGAGILSAIETRARPAGDFIRDEVLGCGFDGLIVIDRNIKFANGQPEILVVATDPRQIKSALGNRGTFDPDSSDIRA